MSPFLLGSGFVAVDGWVGCVVVLNSTAGWQQIALNVRKGTLEEYSWKFMTKSVWLCYPAELSEEVFAALRLAVCLGSTGLPHRPSCGAASPSPG